MKRVVVAMSGGVDSSTALALLKKEGYDCVGVSMQLWDYSKKEDLSGATSGSCCSIDDIYDARGVADRLGVPFYVVNVEEAFSREVVDYFIDGYSRGATPNPCVKCNQVLKFEVLLKKALSLEADFLATGHYARIERDVDGARLLKGADPDKDQSYFLFTMTREQLKRVLFPLGGLRKGEVRAIAREMGLKTSDKKESQEICFVEEPSYSDFLSSRLPQGMGAGDIVDASGRAIGAHRGIYNYTIGQRKGLNLSGGPFYVLEIDALRNRLVVGPVGELYAGGLVASDLNWISERAREMAEKGELRVSSKIRYRHSGAPSVVGFSSGRAQVRFVEPQKAVTPGQAVVFYDNDEVVGGGWIERAL